MIARRQPMTVTERRLTDAALDTAVATRPEVEPTIPDVVEVLRAPDADLRRITACRDDDEFFRDARDLLNSLDLLCTGAIRGIFDRPSTVVVAAAMLCSWAWTGALIDGANVTANTTSVADGGASGRNVLRVQDELWRALRVAPGLVELSDRVTRLGRHRGEISIQVTHCLDDLEALPTPEDRTKARGMASRCGIVVLGGMADREGVTGGRDR